MNGSRPSASPPAAARGCAASQLRGRSRRNGVGPSAVSHAVRAVEDRLGAPLFARTTRSVSLTETGTMLLAAVEPALAEIAEVVERIRADRGRVSGLLRIDAPRVALPIVLTPILAMLARRHPDLTVEIASARGPSGGGPDRAASKFMSLVSGSVPGNALRTQASRPKWKLCSSVLRAHHQPTTAPSDGPFRVRDIRTSDQNVSAVSS